MQYSYLHTDNKTLNNTKRFLVPKDFLPSYILYCLTQIICQINFCFFQFELTVLYHTSGERLKYTMNTGRVKPFIVAPVKDNITGHRSDWSLLGTWEAIAKA